MNSWLIIRVISGLTRTYSEISGEILMPSERFWNTSDNFWSTFEYFWNTSEDFWRLLMTSDARLRLVQMFSDYLCAEHIALGRVEDMAVIELQMRRLGNLEKFIDCGN